jgi:cell division protein FtsL
MATAYRWSEEYSQGLKPTAEESAMSRPFGTQGGLKTRSANQFTVRDDEKGATVEKQRIVPGRVFGAVRNRYCKRPALVEFYTVKRIDNSRLVRHVEPVKLRNLYKTVALGSILAVFCMMYIYQHFRCIDLSFQLEDLKAKQVQAQSVNSELKLEIETLRDPQRIDVIAQKELGLKRPDSAQVREYANPDGAEVAAVQYGRATHP